MEDDEGLVALWQAGDAHALARLVERYSGRVYSYVRRLSGSSEDAEDITSEVFVRVWKGLNSFNTSRTFKTWLYTIARNCTTDYLRKRKSVTFTSLSASDSFEDSLEDSAPMPDEQAIFNADALALEGALATLPIAQRDVLTLHYQEGMTYEEIGVVVGESRDTVKSRGTRALKALRTLLHPNALE